MKAGEQERQAAKQRAQRAHKQQMAATWERASHGSLTDMRHSRSPSARA